MRLRAAGAVLLGVHVAVHAIGRSGPDVLLGVLHVLHDVLHGVLDDPPQPVPCRE
ncbi:Uncharacterised protein [Dermatophilus congolensis]|uniref:Uncharacterized protein n=1 Tax=Dermatophilus congolensis TaxID=1863 RepID=A0AA46H111_9MICO|nr:Uncharacterised protein [Dermatophilus congolensis]